MELIECVECGHLHFNPAARAYEPCPLAPDCDCDPDDTLRRDSRACEMVPDGRDTNGDEWNRCTVHGFQVLGDAYVCEGYTPPPYREPSLTCAR